MFQAIQTIKQGFGTLTVLLIIVILYQQKIIYLIEYLLNFYFFIQNVCRFIVDKIENFLELFDFEVNFKALKASYEQKVYFCLYYYAHENHFYNFQFSINKNLH